MRGKKQPKVAMYFAASNAKRSGLLAHSLSVSLSHDPRGKWRRIREPYQTWTSYHLPVCGDWDRPNAYNRRIRVTYLQLLTLLGCFLRIKIMGVSGGLSPVLWYRYLYYIACSFPSFLLTQFTSSSIQKSSNYSSSPFSFVADSGWAAPQAFCLL